MKIAFYAPFKPLDHPHPSGDRTIARGLAGYLSDQGHELCVQSRLRTRWIYLRWYKWPQLLLELVLCLVRLKKNPPDIWLTYHTYYKAPDILGPVVSRLLKIKYAVFQGIYSTKQRRRLKTAAGFYLNRAALQKADHLFTNKLTDLKNLKRIVPENRLTYVKPGLIPENYKRNRSEGLRMRTAWNTGALPVMLSAAMFRDDVKTKSLIWLIDCCKGLKERQLDFVLVIAGSGVMEKKLKSHARNTLGSSVRFAGKIAPERMAAFYSAGDLFVYPGINEGLGMVFLEAQSCGLPVVAFDNGGIPEAVADKKTGFLTPMYDSEAFQEKMAQLLTREDLRTEMGRQAAHYVRTCHDLKANYKNVETTLIKVASR
jgi:glycosyltransferase involved in cell wall biosynthesis